MAEVVKKLKLDRDYKTYLYFIDGEGSVCRMPKNGKGKTDILVEKAVERDLTYLYFIDRDGNIARSPRGSTRKH